MGYLYLFFCGAVLQAFEVNPQTGVVMATRELRTPVEYPLHVQVRDAGSPPLVADTWLTLRVNCSSAAAAAAARAPADDVVGRSQLGGMLLFVVVAAVASSLLLVCVLAASLVLRHCVSSRRLPTASKPPQSGHVTSPAGAPRGASSADSDDSTLKIARGGAMTSQRSWYPAHCNSLKAPHYPPPPRSLAVASLPACSSVGRFRPMTAGTYSHVTPSGRSQQVPVTSSFADDVRYRLLYGANVVPTVQHSV